jgi:Flp pilus assembly protein TadG
MDPRNAAPNAVPEPQTGRTGRSFFLRSRRKEASGQAIVEFAIVSLAFFMMVFGTIDFGRAIYMYSQLHNAVQDGARVGKTDPAGVAAIQNKVIDVASSFDLTADDVTVTCYKSDGTLTDQCSTSSKIRVEATAEFTAITQDFLGISPITLKASSRVATE